MNQIDTTFSALADSTRRAIVEQLARQETSLSDLAAPFAMSQTAVTKHVLILRDAGLVAIDKRGRTRYCRLQPAKLKEAEQWLQTYQQFWAEQFDQLATYLNEDKTS